MKIRNIYLLILFCFVTNFGFSQSITLPKLSQIKWHKAEMGAIFHYDLHVFDGKRYNQSDNRINPIEDYNIFNPNQLNTDQWVLAAKAAGCKFALITATHETGFGLWQSDVNPYCMKALKFQNGKGDIVRDFVNSCRKYGLQPGIYIGIRWNSLLGIHNFRVEGNDEFAINRQIWYKHYCERMVKELCTRYGELFMIWFDGGADNPKENGPDVEPIVNKYQPTCLFYHNTERADLRWGGSESGTVGYPCWSTFSSTSSHDKRLESNNAQLNLLMHGDKDGKYWVPAMADTPLRCANNRHEWFWEPGDENSVCSLEELMNKYEKSVGRNATLIVGLTPDTTGLIPKGDVQRLKEWGEEINRRYGTPIAKTSGEAKTLILKWKKKIQISHCIIQEDIAKGERIRQYIIEAKIKGKWNKICSGESVGNKRIESFYPIETNTMRLIVKQSNALPVIINFSAFKN
jgi:alpha-L-fucosidase